MRLFEESEELVENLTQHKIEVIGDEMLKRLALKYYRDHGYVSGGYGYVAGRGNVYSQSPTLIDFKRFLDNMYDEPAEDWERYAAPLDDVVEIERWIEGWEAPSFYPEYVEKLKAAWRKHGLQLSDLIFLLSGCHSYKKHKEDDEIDRFFQGVRNEYLGNVGDKVEVIIDRALDRTKNKATSFSPANVNYVHWYVVDNQNRLLDFFVDKSEEKEVGDLTKKKGYKIIGKINARREFKGRFLTHIVFDKVSEDEPVRTKAGFFN